MTSKGIHATSSQFDIRKTHTRNIHSALGSRKRARLGAAISVSECNSRKESDEKEEEEEKFGGRFDGVGGG